MGNNASWISCKTSRSEGRIGRYVMAGGWLIIGTPGAVVEGTNPLVPELEEEPGTGIIPTV